MPFPLKRAARSPAVVADPPPGVPALQCPVCRTPLAYVEARDTPITEWFVYRCARHGRWAAGPDNRFVPERTS